MTTRLVKPAFAAIAAAGFAAAAFATPAPALAKAQSIAIEWRDLNLETPEGQRALDRRIDTAARKACGMNDTRTGTRFVSRDARDCYQKAKVGARAQVAAIREETRLGG